MFRRRALAFTLVEMLVGVGILAVLLSIYKP
jgi:prepilin-type N-terminal cleavage/methylation domain-containing protein